MSGIRSAVMLCIPRPNRRISSQLQHNATFVAFRSDPHPWHSPCIHSVKLRGYLLCRFALEVRESREILGWICWALSELQVDVEGTPFRERILVNSRTERHSILVNTLPSGCR